MLNVEKKIKNNPKKNPIENNLIFFLKIFFLYNENIISKIDITVIILTGIDTLKKPKIDIDMTKINKL